MRVLIVGGDARSHALAWKIRRDRPDVQLLLAPGTDGSAVLGERLALTADDIPALLRAAREREVELTIVSPEVALAAGIADAFAAAGMRIFGPTEAAATIETSKAWAKAFMQRHSIPTARFVECSSPAEADAAIRSFAKPPVIKDDRLASGKGVVVPDTFEEARAAARAIFSRPGSTIVIEERLVGWEMSAMAFCDGRHALLMPASCDYKRVGDGDTGPNTGGMGAYAPAGISSGLRDQILDDIVRPAVDGMAEEGRPFVGVLYPGLMITPEGPKVIEFNCRFGDPEAEVLLPLLRTDLVSIVEACLDGGLGSVNLEWSAEACVAVVLAPPGYPDDPRPTSLENWQALESAVAFRAAGASGRLLTVSATGADLPEARARAYAALAQVRCPGAVYRTDIAAFDRALG